MAIKPINISGNSKDVVSSSDRLVCNPGEQSSSNICISSPVSLPSQRVKRKVGKLGKTVRISSNSSHSRSSSKVFKDLGKKRVNINNPKLAKQDLVQRGQEHVESNLADPQQSPSTFSDGAKSKGFLFPLVDMEFMRDEVLKINFINKGFSDTALKTAIGSVRPQTNKIYNKHFSMFCKYMREKKQLKDLNEVQDHHLAAYLLHLNELKLAYNKLISIRTAIRVPLMLVNESDVLLSHSLQLIFKGIKASKPPKRAKPVCWNLPIVLEMLRSDAFTPLSKLSEEALLRKTLFLLAIASGKRASELGALGAAEPYCTFPHKDKVVLGYLPGFLAKNESLQNLHSNIILEGIRSIAPDKIELELCPVRTLKRYIERT